LLDLTVGPAQSRDEVAKAFLVRADVWRARLATKRLAASDPNAASDSFPCT
jgi:hypothetical protein